MEVEGHQSDEFSAIVGQVVQHPRDGRLHRLEGVMPAAQRFAAHEFPEAFDEVEIGRIRGQELEDEDYVLLPLLLDPRTHQLGVMVLGIVEIEDKLPGRRLAGADFFHQGDQRLGVEGGFGDADIEIFLALGAESTQDIEAVPAAADTNLEALAFEQPAREDIVHAVGRMPAVDEVAARGAGLGFGRLRVEVDEVCFLLGAVGLEQEAAGLVETAADAMQELLDAARRVVHGEAFFEEAADLAGAMEAARANFGLQFIDLGGSQVSRIAAAMQNEKGVQALRAIDTQPTAYGPDIAAEQLGDFRPRPPVGGPEQGLQASEQASILGRRQEGFDSGANVRRQVYVCHGISRSTGAAAKRWLEWQGQGAPSIVPREV